MRIEDPRQEDPRQNRVPMHFVEMKIKITAPADAAQRKRRMDIQRSFYAYSINQHMQSRPNPSTPAESRRVGHVSNHYYSWWRVPLDFDYCRLYGTVRDLFLPGAFPARITIQREILYINNVSHLYDPVVIQLGEWP